MTTIHIINKIPFLVLHLKTPFEILFKKLPTYDLFWVFGCLAFSLNPSFSHDKFEHRGVPCLFLGYPPLTKGYKLLNLQNQQAFVSRDVKINENVFPYHVKSADTFMKPTPPSYPLTEDIIYSIEDLYSRPSTPPASPNTHTTPDSPPTSSLTPVIQPPPVRRSTRLHKPPSWLDDYATANMCTISSTVNTTLSKPFYCFLFTLTTTTDPTSFKIAVQSPQLVQAMNNELDALELNDTCEVTTLPPDCHSIECK